jgi:protein-tyrosine phosphatase
MPFDRVLDLHGVHNLRDCGGYAVAGGGRLKRGVLWRSGQHVGATDADLEVIAGLGLTSVFDLRSAHERTVNPCRRPAGFVAKAVVRRDAAGARESMRANYHRIAFRAGLVTMVRRYIETAAAGGGPVLVNCMAGKDRTGIAVAMLHHVAGVHRDDILADYLLTNTAGDIDARIAAGMASIRATGSDLAEDVMHVLMGVEAEYLEAAFERIAEECGSIDGYLRDVVGLDGLLRERLMDALVEV